MILHYKENDRKENHNNPFFNLNTPESSMITNNDEVLYKSIEIEPEIKINEVKNKVPNVISIEDNIKSELKFYGEGIFKKYD